ncbi:MAG: hypothetical protein WCZ19_03305 [Acholeplasma sp.]
MNKTIEKYIYSVTRRCPEDKRDEISKELESNIMDMLQNDPNYTEDDIETVLHKLGHPIDVAYQYQTTNQHVVDPRFYQDFKLFVKVGLIFSSMLAVVVGIITSLTEMDVNQPGSIFGSLISHILSNLSTFGLSVFALITLAFWSYKLPKVKANIDEKLKNWKVSDLIDVPKFDVTPDVKSRVKILVEMIFVAIILITSGTLFLLFYETVFILNINGVTSQFLNSAYKGVFTFFIISSITITMLNYLYRFYAGRETFYTLLTSTFTEFYGAIFVVIILLLPELVLIQNYQMLADYFNTSLVNVTNIATIITYSTIAIILLTSFIYYFIRWIKYLKNRNFKR